MAFLVLALLIAVSGVLASTWHAVFEEKGFVRIVFLTPLLFAGAIVLFAIGSSVLDPVSLGCSGNAIKGFRCSDAAPWYARLGVVLSEAYVAAFFLYPVFCAGFLLAVLYRRGRRSGREMGPGLENARAAIAVRPPQDS